MESSFSTTKQYLEIMKPLFFEETKAGMERVKAEMIPELEWVQQTEWRPPPKNSRIDEAQWLEITVRRHDMVEMRARYNDDKILYQQGDLILLSEAASPEIYTNCHAIGVIEKAYRDILTIRCVLIKTPRHKSLVTKMMAAPPEGPSKWGWFIGRLGGFATAMREFNALYALDRIDTFQHHP